MSISKTRLTTRSRDTSFSSALDASDDDASDDTSTGLILDWSKSTVLPEASDFSALSPASASTKVEECFGDGAGAGLKRRKREMKRVKN